MYNLVDQTKCIIICHDKYIIIYKFIVWLHVQFSNEHDMIVHWEANYYDVLDLFEGS